MIEGDEGEVVMQNDIPRGESLLTKDYLLLDDHEQTAATPATNTNTAAVIPASSSGSSTGVITITTSSASSVAVQRAEATEHFDEHSSQEDSHHSPSPSLTRNKSVPSMRPVTPQSFRSHSSATVRSCKFIQKTF